MATRPNLHRALARRALLGIELPPAEAAFARDGMVAAAVVPGSMADAAGILANDVVLRIGERPVASADDLRVALRRAGESEVVTLVAERAGATFERSVRVQRRPSEALDGHDVLYDHVLVDGVRVRTLVTRPSDSERHPAVLVVQGLSSESIDFGASPGAPLCRLVHGLAGEGFVTMRVEKRGVGDSEGESPERTDFVTEVGDVRSALHTLGSLDFVDRDAVFVFGHSIGGMIAPLLAGDGGVRGVLTYGTSAARWLDCLAATSRRQLALRGVAAEAIERRVRRDREDLLTRPVVDGRPAAFHEQLDAANIAVAWSRVDRPVLVLHGEHDWVVGEDEERAIVEIVNAKRPATARFVHLAGLDHLMTRHPSLADSLRAYGNGAFAPEIVTESSRWMRRTMGV